MRPYLAFLLLLPSAGAAGAAGDEEASSRGEGAAGATASAGLSPNPSPGLVVERGDELAYTIPDAESLTFAVVVDIAVLGETGLGNFELSAGTEEHRTGLAASEPGAATGARVGWIRGHAAGSYVNYQLDHVIEVRVLPQDWPRVIYRNTQRGSENRRRELMYGTRDGKLVSWYRSDRHCKGCSRPEHFLEGTWPFSSDHHCKKCRRAEHRVWKKPELQDVPEHSVDMMSAIHLARAMVRAGLQEVRFPMLDKDRYWNVVITRGERKRIDAPAGTFACREVKLDPHLPPDSEEEERFEGLFGIHGTLSIWLHEETGVPVLIEGVVPAGPLDVDVSLSLKEYRGTPENFRPAGAR